ncbi:methyltransferase family protein [Ulvibacter sp. MAR_2010_11]|uniref:class I SAM-dependent methyltransferase n=1 Tax=Ulvibacter sp. MAR_2010_11 TaxID=1250229 RepID=UPI000C2C3416|nr:class I SAM-dependent methyltransferase [Ulvibacter sp. MAR_2010_11]PKA82009.1 methyltransferase family protein [Ulvibacter sp. MAR_2010_11]
MNNTELSKSYDKIAGKWNDEMLNSTYGLSMVERAIQFCTSKAKALDVGCGSGGRIINKILDSGFNLTAIDISHNMLELARNKHHEVNFMLADITKWETTDTFDLVVAWDSIFHLPVKSHASVLKKLCNLLSPNGILLYTFGDAIDEHIDMFFSFPNINFQKITL